MKTDIVAGRRPVYEGLVESLRRKIAEAKIPPGKLIGSEYQLATDFGLSRHSVRKAIDCLISDGLAVGLLVRSRNTAALRNRNEGTC